MSKKSSLAKQKVAVGIGLALFAMVLIYVVSLVIKDAPLGEYVEGEHYLLIENPRRMRGDKIQVTEFFSYACIYCFELEDDIAAWVEKNKDVVEFKRVPAISNNAWRALARGYFSLEQMGILEDMHLALFHAIHNKGTILSSRDALAKFVEDEGADKDEFLKAYDSAKVGSLMKNADSLQRRYKVASTPSLVVRGKYLVRTTLKVGRSRVLDVVDHLIEKELAEMQTERGELRGISLPAD